MVKLRCVEAGTTVHDLEEPCCFDVFGLHVPFIESFPQARVDEMMENLRVWFGVALQCLF